MEQIKIKPIFYFHSPAKEWVNVVKFYGRKEYGSVYLKNKLKQVNVKKYFDFIYFRFNNKTIMTYNKHDKGLMVNYYNIWKPLQHEFNYYDNEMLTLIPNIVESESKLKILRIWVEWSK